MQKSFDKIVIYPRTGQRKDEAVKDARDVAIGLDHPVVLDFNGARIKISNRDTDSENVLEARLTDALSNS